MQYVIVQVSVISTLYMFYVIWKSWNCTVHFWNSNNAQQFRHCTRFLCNLEIEQRACTICLHWIQDCHYKQSDVKLLPTALTAQFACLLSPSISHSGKGGSHRWLLILIFFHNPELLKCRLLLYKQLSYALSHYYHPFSLATRLPIINNQHYSC